MKHHVNPHLTQLLQQGLYAIWKDIPIDDQLEAYPTPIQHLFRAQCDIGWEQLYYGRISVQWAQYLTTSSNYTTNGDTFYTNITTMVWQYILDCWKLCNNALHYPMETLPEAQTLIAQAQQILDMVHNDPVLAHIALPPQPENLMMQPIHQLRKWVQHGKMHLDQYLTAVHKCAILHTCDISKYFPIKQANDLQPPA